MEDRNFNYIKDLTRYQRQQTSTVQIGKVPMGSAYPIRVQSMTDTDSKDTEATVEQIIRIIKAGADYVRVTVKGVNDAENLRNIKRELVARGYETPLIADIHFNPKLAEIAAKYISKIRINPGNFYDKRARFEQHLYTDEEYKEELIRIEEQFIPFLEVLKQTNTALRIGANQGSLSDRIMSRYGDTPAGISESVMEFLRICKKVDYKNVVISIKSSNTRMMVYTVRLLNKRMRLEDMEFPLHLGVTEAGEGEDGRIKSAVGIGALLADGIGDTIRVSLTENPEKEIPVARKMIDHIKTYQNHEPIKAPLFAQTNPFEYERRSVRPVMNMGGKQVPVVVADLRNRNLSEVLPMRGKQIPEYFLKKDHILDIEGNSYPILDLEEYLFGGSHWGQMKFIRTNKMEFDRFMSENPEIITKLKQTRKTVLILESFNKNPLAELRAFFMALESHIWKVPVIILRSYKENRLEDLQIKASVDLGGLLIDGYGDGICITNDSDNITFTDLKDLSFSVLQASRMRVTKTEFISCPGCGRTLFDLHETTLKIKAHFKHLSHLKIGVMGCVVNGPGEMGDVDYGFVGAGPGKINLYKGQSLKKRHIPFENAVYELESLIKENGDWKEPEDHS
ncbi:(E)-4-hydroxy-3-methylbut-2-enyl-diphosphate synthase [Gaoshiqia sp. Z1-71]|uniref:(E)-4-hydroxy-3-methylbut-2-enyl-diphosphate synthase n=1 Tax=Gaoshiqia hydrogeniformans TaxID=3290090 RepID=UPI003BF8A5A4